jgi:hypothetical protein
MCSSGYPRGAGVKLLMTLEGEAAKGTLKSQCESQVTYVHIFFLKRAGELRIIILRRRKGPK